MTLLRAPAAELGFAVRQLLRWSRGEPAARAEHCAPSFDWADPARRAALRSVAADLGVRFDLSGLLGWADDAVWSRNLARLDQLERLRGELPLLCGEDGVVRAADFGCGDFHYAAALQQWLSRAGAERPRRVVLRGIELDGHGLYRDGHSRADHGRHRARAASVGGSEVRYEVADAAAVRLPPQDVVTLFFPFLTAHACLSWGTPLSRLRPRRLLRRAVESLRPHGLLVVANQTPREYARLRLLLRELPLVPVARTSFASDLSPDALRTAGQVGSLWRRQAGPDPR